MMYEDEIKEYLAAYEKSVKNLILALKNKDAESEKIEMSRIMKMELDVYEATDVFYLEKNKLLNGMRQIRETALNKTKKVKEEVAVRFCLILDALREKTPYEEREIKKFTNSISEDVIRVFSADLVCPQNDIIKEKKYLERLKSIEDDIDSYVEYKQKSVCDGCKEDDCNITRCQTNVALLNMYTVADSLKAIKKQLNALIRVYDGFEYKNFVYEINSLKARFTSKYNEAYYSLVRNFPDDIGKTIYDLTKELLEVFNKYEKRRIMPVEDQLFVHFDKNAKEIAEKKVFQFPKDSRVLFDQYSLNIDEDTDEAGITSAMAARVANAVQQSESVTPERKAVLIKALTNRGVFPELFYFDGIEDEIKYLTEIYKDDKNEAGERK